MSNPEVTGPYWDDAGDDFGRGRRGRQDGWPQDSQPRSSRPRSSQGPDSGGRGGYGRAESAGGRPEPASPARGPREASDPWSQQQGGSRGQGGRSGPDGSRFGRSADAGGGSRAPRGSRGTRGYPADRGGGSGQVAQDLRDRLGVSGPGRPTAADGRPRDGVGPSDGGSRGYDSPRGGHRAAAGPAQDSRSPGAYGRTAQRGRPGTSGDPRWDTRDPRGDLGSGGGRRTGGGRGGSGGNGGGAGGPGRSGGGRRGLKEWFMSGDWWRRWTWKKALAVAGGACVGVVVLAGAAFAVAYSDTSLPTSTIATATEAPSLVYFSNGHPMGSFTTGLNRQVLTPQQIPSVVKNAIIAAEDRHFYTEGGISPTGLLRAAYEDIRGGDVTQGGSTLTEQLVKNYYTGFAGAGNSDKNANDKFKQILVAIKLAHTESKSTILTQYLNTVYFGQNAYGIQAASETYFSKPVSKLNASQAAMLAAMVNQPGYFNPDPHAGAPFTALKARWEYVLGNMVRDGQLTSAKAQAFEKASVPQVHYQVSLSNSGYKGYLMQMVQQELTSTYHYTQAQLDTDGLKITTTFSQSLMKGLYQAVATDKKMMTADGRSLPSYAHVGSVLEQPTTGDIRAVYAGPGYTSNEKKCLREDCDYNMAENPKQVGSSFKPYVLATAVSEGMDVQDSVLNGFSPLWIPEGESPADRAELSSQTGPPAGTYLKFDEADEDSGKGLSVANAAAISSDPAFEDLAHRAGVQQVIGMARALGIGQTPFVEGDANDLKALNAQYGPNGAAADSVNIALGEGDLTAVEQASTFATFADGGVYHSPTVIAKIAVAGGDIPLRRVTRNVLNSAQAADVDYALSFDNVAGGTAYPQAAWPGRSVIGKTGTTQTAQDAWFVGSVPQYSLSVALFTNQQNSSTGPGAQTLDILPVLPDNATGGYGGAWPAEIWHTFMSDEFTDLAVDPLPTPDYTGFTLWNQVTGATTVAPTVPVTTPTVTPTPSVTPTCTPGFGQDCNPGGGFTPPPTPTVTPTFSPTPTVTPTFSPPSIPPGHGHK